MAQTRRNNMALTPRSRVPYKSELLSSMGNVRSQFRTGDFVACMLPDVKCFSAAGKVVGIRPPAGGIDELDEYIVEFSPTVLGVCHAEELLLLE
jgi:hypothetical protein